MVFSWIELLSVGVTSAHVTAPSLSRYDANDLKIPARSWNGGLPVEEVKDLVKGWEMIQNMYFRRWGAGVKRRPVQFLGDLINEKRPI